MKTSITPEESQAVNFQKTTQSISLQDSDIVPSYKNYTNPFVFKGLKLTGYCSSQLCAISTLLLSVKQV